MSPSRAPVRLRLPATSANLGPGFDTLGLALSLYLNIEAREAAETTIQATGRNQDICGSLSNNLILMTYREVLGALGVAAPELALTIHNEIPIGMGCGSSAAALVAGLLLAQHFAGVHLTQQQILDEAARREGHPDNVAACLCGGLTVAAVCDGATAAVPCGRDLDGQLLLALPTASLSTAEARRVLPATYSRQDAVANVQSSSLLVAAFCSGRTDLLRCAMRDRLHQPYRRELCPLFERLEALWHEPDVLGLALSGAGPAVLVVIRSQSSWDAIRTAGGEALGELLEVRVAGGAEFSSE